MPPETWLYLQRVRDESAWSVQDIAYRIYMESLYSSYINIQNAGLTYYKR